jgi:hypothetical protein
MDVEPLVRQERRSVSLEPLAAAFSQLQQLSISDATYTRDPWSLEQLAWLPKLSSLSMSWDTGLWAPGQVAQEADALQVRPARSAQQSGFARMQPSQTVHCCWTHCSTSGTRLRHQELARGKRPLGQSSQR